MAHSVLQTGQVAALNSHKIPTKKSPLLHPSLHLLPRKSFPCSFKVSRNIRKLSTVTASASVVDGESIASLERCLRSSPDSSSSLSSSSSSSSMPAPTMKKNTGAQYGSTQAVTLEKGKIQFSSPKPQEVVSRAPETATGGGGGDIGKKINHGGGDGGDDGGDDDDYFGDFDDFDEGDEGGFFRRRLVLQELFDRKFVDAVLNEWQKTMMDLPAGLRQAYEMGLVSSAQMVSFLAINARPTTARFISRSLPEGVSRAFVGRMIADPAFLYKLLLEQAATVGCTLWWEVKNRKDRIRQEWDLALINVLTVSACNAIVVWSLAPCRSYGSTFRFDLQNTIQKLPNNIFERSYPQRSFDLQKRIHSLFYKVAELCTVGFTAGAIQGALSNVLARKKEGRLSVTMPTVSANALGYGAFLGLFANLRYQLLCGVDRAVVNHFDVIGVAIVFTTALRLLNAPVGETSRLAWLGVEPDPMAQSENLLKAYNRPSSSEDVARPPTSNWFISKNAVVSGLGLLGIKQEGNSDEEAPPKARRKRVVRKKVTTSSA